MRGPELRADVHDTEPDGDDEEEECAMRLPVQPFGLDLFDAVVVDERVDGGGVERCAGDAVQHPGQDGAEEGAVDEVDGEGVAAEPEEEGVGEHGFGGVAGLDAKGDEVDPERGVAFRQVGDL